MEINLKKLNEQAVESTTGSRKMRLSDDSAAIVFQMFSKNIYSNPIGSIVREITSNCFDSHIEAKVNSPVVIRKTVDQDTGTISVSFIDYGMGMSPDRVENIYGVYFESTKRVDNTQIGGFGIGGKSVLAYRRPTGHGQGDYDNSFNVITNFDGIRYYYCIYDGSESPIISLLHSEPTTERNGTEVRVTVLSGDVSKFENEMIRQLYYFENVIFEGFDNSILSNNYQIVRGKSFLFRGKDYSNYAHVCLGRVAYPIDFPVLGLNSGDYEFPIAIRLEIGDINVTPSRETLNYSEATIKMLKKKLEAAKKEITELLIKQYDNIVTLEDYFKAKNKFGTLFFSNGSSFNVEDVIKFKDVDFSNFRFNFLKMPDDVQLFNFFFNVRLFGKKEGRYSRRYGNGEGCFKGEYDELQGGKNLYYFEGEFSRKIVKQAWLKTLHQRYYTITPNNLLNSPIKTMSGVAELFNVHDTVVKDDDNGNLVPTTYMETILGMQKEYFDIVRENCTNYGSIEVPADFIENRKAEKLSQEIKNSTIPVSMIGGSRERVKVEHLIELNIPIFYGTKEDETALETAMRTFGLLFNKDIIVKTYGDYYHSNGKFNLKDKKGIMFLMVAKNNVQYMQYCKKASHISTIYWKLFHRKAEAVAKYFQSQNFLDKFKTLDPLYRSLYFKNVSPTFGRKIDKITSYMSNLDKGGIVKDLTSSYNRDAIKRYYVIDNLQATKEQIVLNADVQDLLDLQTLNHDVLRHINMPYSFASVDDTFWNVLKKVLTY